MASDAPNPELQDEIDRRLEIRRAADRDRHRTLLTLTGFLITVVTILVSLGVAWGTSTAALAQKVDKVEQLKVDAGMDARITVNTQKIDGIQHTLDHISAVGDSTSSRVREIYCIGKPAGCR